MNPDRLVAIKKQALKSIASRANNPLAPGVSMVAITPHEALEMVAAIDDQLTSILQAKSPAPEASKSTAAPTAKE
jgi:hypothetical protein